MRNIPKVVYAGGTVLLFSLPQRAWTPGSTVVGGTDTSAAGVPETFVVRRDRTLDVRLRFREAEWPAVRAWLEWAQDTAGAFDWYPDRDLATGHTCYLASPPAGEEIRPERSESFRGHWEIALRLRTADGSPIEPSFYP